MRTNIEIDDALMAEAMRASGGHTKRETVERGLRMLVERRAIDDLLALRGTVNWTGDLDGMRRDG